MPKLKWWTTMKRIPPTVDGAMCENCDASNTFSFFISRDNKSLYFKCKHCKTVFKLDRRELAKCQ